MLAVLGFKRYKGKQNQTILPWTQSGYEIVFQMVRVVKRQESGLLDTIV